MSKCKVHRYYKHAGIYKRDKHGQIMLNKNGGRVYLPADETWACPHCNIVFLKPKNKKKIFKKRRKR